MDKILFASKNEHKLSEIRDILKDRYDILSLNSINHTEELDEDGETLEENALQKARFIYNTYNINCFAEDTGLEVEALNGAPGVNTAHYAGPQRSASDNINLLLKNLKENSNRKACFKTVIALIIDGSEYIFKGEVYGTISEVPFGNAGFGYDPVFIPEGFDKTFSQLPSEVKNEISHRGRAVQQLITFLEKK